MESILTVKLYQLALIGLTIYIFGVFSVLLIVRRGY